MTSEVLRKGLERIARERLGGRLAALARLSGGASQELWALDVETEVGLDRYVLRRSRDGGPERALASGLATEARVIAAAGRAGAPVAQVALVLAPEDGLGPGFIAERVEGETLGRRIVHSEAFAQVRPHLAAQCGVILARIHALAPDPLSLPRRTPAEVLEGLAGQLQRSRLPRPVHTLALRWLRDHAPAPGRLAVVHGDFRTGNLMIGPQGVVAVLDWEGVHLGDPMADLGWLCMPTWRFGRLDRPVGGFGDREDLYAAYERAGGRSVDAQAVRFWEVAGMLRWGLTCVLMSEEFADGDRSVERGAIGRRAVESELDILAALAPEAAP